MADRPAAKAATMTEQAKAANLPAKVVRSPAHLTAEQAAVWSALRLAIDAADGESVTADQVTGCLRAIDPLTASRPLRVALLLEGLVVDRRTTVAAVRALGGDESRYGM